MLPERRADFQAQRRRETTQRPMSRGIVSDHSPCVDHIVPGHRENRARTIHEWHRETLTTMAGRLVSRTLYSSRQSSSNIHVLRGGVYCRKEPFGCPEVTR
jgi:hypothetical protein